MFVLGEDWTTIDGYTESQLTSESKEAPVVLAHMGLMDSRAYVRLAAILRQQITDGTLRPGE